jgi:hypothetical protein
MYMAWVVLFLYNFCSIAWLILYITWDTQRERGENWLKKIPKEERQLTRENRSEKRQREQRGMQKLIWGAVAAQAWGARLCEPGPLVNLPRCARSMCRASSSADAHTWPSAEHAWRVLPQDFYALTESWNGSGRRSRHPAPPRMKKRRAEPPRDQPGANSHASCSPAERRHETAGARLAAMAQLRLLYVPVSRSRRRP